MCIYGVVGVDFSMLDSSIVAIPILGDNMMLEPRDRGGPTANPDLGDADSWFDGERD
jgi:hypothetical protein